MKNRTKTLLTLVSLALAVDAVAGTNVAFDKGAGGGKLELPPAETPAPAVEHRPICDPPTPTVEYDGPAVVVAGCSALRAEAETDISDGSTGAFCYEYTVAKARSFSQYRNAALNHAAQDCSKLHGKKESACYQKILEAEAPKAQFDRPDTASLIKTMCESDLRSDVRENASCYDHATKEAGGAFAALKEKCDKVSNLGSRAYCFSNAILQ